MKLILCYTCQSITGLSDEVRTCVCGRSQATYLDGRNAIYSGPCIPLGIDNNGLVEAVKKEAGPFSAFVIPSRSRYFRRVDDEVEKREPIRIDRNGDGVQ